MSQKKGLIFSLGAYFLAPLYFYLEEEAKGDPLVVFVVSSLSGVVGPVHPGVGDLQPSLLPEGAGDGVGGVYPAVGVDNVLKKQTTGKKRMQF